MREVYLILDILGILRQAKAHDFSDYVRNSFITAAYMMMRLRGFLRPVAAPRICV